jgi:SagB-type dehydrogenase family enzyme
MALFQPTSGVALLLLFTFMMRELSPSELVLAYHRRTKHRFEAYARGPAALDWDDQPALFRRFADAPLVRLPLAAEVAPPLQASLQRPWHSLAQTEVAAISIESIGVLLNLSLAITAWKSLGPDRWALRANPSSGNLHPVEGYLIVAGIAGLADGLYHYCPDEHVLECRTFFTQAPTGPLLCIGFSTLMWREAWKYGERGFRYCQLDIGHATASVAYAAAALGWTVAKRRELSTERLAHLLGVDREADFPAQHPHTCEREEAQLLMQLADSGRLADFDTDALVADACWQGRASAIDPKPRYRWPIIDEVTVATRHSGGASLQPREIAQGGLSVAAEQSSGPPLCEVILGRRSAQRFDPRASLATADFFAMLAAVMSDNAVPWSALAGEPQISLVLFVHRVVDLEPGLYLLARRGEHRTAMAGRFSAEPVATAPGKLPLYRLTTAEPQELRRIARAIHCHQDIAADAFFALGMVAEFSAPIAENPAAYRELFMEAGMIGQVLYLEAEACGLRGTGIGCFFDDPFHELLGLEGEAFQSIYHFTVGLPINDDRLEISIAYPHR